MSHRSSRPRYRSATGNGAQSTSGSTRSPSRGTAEGRHGDEALGVRERGRDRALDLVAELLERKLAGAPTEGLDVLVGASMLGGLQPKDASEGLHRLEDARLVAGFVGLPEDDHAH